MGSERRAGRQLWARPAMWPALVILGMVVAFVSAGSVALARTAKGPQAPGLYRAITPLRAAGGTLLLDVDVQNNPPTKVGLVVQCGLPRNKLSVTEIWNSPTIPFRHNAFRFHGKASISKLTTNALNVTVKQSRYKSTARVDGRFTKGRFVGKVHLGGSPCGNIAYSARVVPQPTPA
jgi:hypothetical protein